MTKLYQAFNQTLLQFLNQLRLIFPEETGLQQETVRYNLMCQQDRTTTEIFDLFKKEVQPHRDHVYNKNPAILTESPFFLRLGLAELYKGFDKEETEIFWKGMTNLIRYTAMLKACGSQLDSMEGMASQFMKKNPNLKPEEYHSALFKEMLSGGEMSKQLMKTFENKDSIVNILENVGDILRGPENKDSLDLSSLTKLVTGEGAEEFDMQKDFKEFQQVMKAGGFAVPEEEEDEDEETKE